MRTAKHRYGVAHIAVAGASVLLAISGVVGAGAQANAIEPAAPLSPVSQQPLNTVSQQNAVRKAEDYLDYTAFSRRGLIEQLEFEGFSTEDATFAVDHVAVDWNEQAAKKAEDYLDYTSFSRSGLIEQLEFEGFTPAQAAYGVAAVGL
ncbi:Ltp family lipoprotein [Mycobacterium sp. B14F4]|uniref:Ltp family lipoprotein n=1 Tax=Mycobacterium sp. B14F4 TaxID=3153565 RepID=UPI00325F5F8E